MRDFSQAKRIVIKVGTNVLSRAGRVDTGFLQVVAGQISQLVKQGRQVILVTSGAIGMGAGTLNIDKKITSVKMRQACAAIGQSILMHEYQMAFGRCGQLAGQVLLTNAIMSNRKYYVNIKNAVETMLSMSVVPIVNENDCVSIDEIGLAFGDNDLLSALVASKIDAELLIILTDVDGLYDKNPRKSKTAKLVPVVYELTDEIEAMAGKAGSQLGTGGMKSKINAIRIAAQGGCKVILANGRTDDVILKIVNGREIGTLFLPKRRLSNRKRWILNAQAKGYIEIDPGAKKAIKDNRSLLLVGITAVKGSFKPGDIVEIGNTAKGIPDISSAKLKTMLKQKKQHKPGKKPKAIVHANNIVLLEA